MIKSPIFDTKQMLMRRPLFFSFVLMVLLSASAVAQYTETINTYRPGTSQGAFGVGKNVIQFETGVAFGSENHDLLQTKTKTTEFQYNFRVGLFKEQLEFGLQGSYLSQNVDPIIGKRSGFPFNVLGAKYLIYDPYKYKREQTSNIISWKANQKPNWKKFIPAVSAYLGANFNSTSSEISPQNRPETRITEAPPSITPKFVIAAQNVWSEKLVFTINLVSENLSTDYHTFRFIGTTTYNFNQYFSFFGEYEAVSSSIYKDHLLKAGAAYLLTKDLQFDARLLGNLKSTPSIVNFALGASYRLDYHKNSDNEYIDTGEDHDAKKYVELIKKDIESGHLDESVLSGKLQSVSEDGVIVDRFKGIDLEEFVQEEEEEEEFDEEFDNDIEEEDTRIRWWQIGKRKRLRKKALSDTTSTKPVLGSGGRRSDFLDDEFIKQKQAEITPAERTPEELAELELRREEKRNKKKKRKLFGKKDKSDEIYIDALTGDTIAPPDYSGMSKKERKIARKQHRDLFKLDNLDFDGFVNEVETEQNTREAEKERKRKEKQARKAAKKAKKNQNKADLNEDYDEEWGNQLPEKEPKKENEVNSDIDNLEFEEDKELKQIEAELAKEEEKERKRLEKEAALEAKREKQLAKENSKKQAKEDAARKKQEAIQAKQLEQEQINAEKKAASEKKQQKTEIEAQQKLEAETQKAAQAKAEKVKAEKKAREDAIRKKQEAEKAKLKEAENQKAAQAKAEKEKVAQKAREEAIRKKQEAEKAKLKEAENQKVAQAKAEKEKAEKKAREEAIRKKREAEKAKLKEIEAKKVAQAKAEKEKAAKKAREDAARKKQEAEKATKKKKEVIKKEEKPKKKKKKASKWDTGDDEDDEEW